MFGNLSSLGSLSALGVQRFGSATAKSWIFSIPDAGGTSTPSATTTGSIQWDAYEGGVLAATYTGSGEKEHTFPAGSGSYWKLSFPNGDPQLVSNYSFYLDIIIGEFPRLYFSSVTDVSYAWRYSQFTGAFPLLDFSSVTDVSRAWQSSQFTGAFPLLDFSSVTVMPYAWNVSRFSGAFPLLDFSSVTDVGAAWRYSQFTGAFPLLDFSSVTVAAYAWQSSQFTTFPVGIFNGCPCTNFTYAFYGMNLDQTGVDNIFIGINSNGTSNGTLHINGGTSPAPTGEGLAAMVEMQGRGWTIYTN